MGDPREGDGAGPPSPGEVAGAVGGGDSEVNLGCPGAGAEPREQEHGGRGAQGRR